MIIILRFLVAPGASRADPTKNLNPFTTKHDFRRQISVLFADKITVSWNEISV